MQRIVARWNEAGRSAWAPLLLGLGGVVVAFLVRESLGPAADGGPFMIYLPAVLLAFATGNLLAGAIVTATAAVLAGSALDSANAVGLAIFLLIAALVALLSLATRETLRSLLAAERTASEQLALRQTLIQEMRHRMANTIQFTASTLQLQRRRLGSSPASARAALDATLQRLDVMSRVHRRLYDPAGSGLLFEDLLREICRDLIVAADRPEVVCRVSAAPTDLPIEKLISLALIVTETVLNALKHAYAEADAGIITIEIGRLDDGRFQLCIRDDGPGLPDGFDPARAAGLGLRIVQGLAQQLGGELKLGSESGTVLRLAFAA